MKNPISKKQKLLKTAARLFAAQGFDGTTTLQIARESGVTEPLIYYHFKGKDDLFTRIIESTFSEYFSRIDSLEGGADGPFEQIRKLIDLQFDIVEDMPDEVHLIASAGPARLSEPTDICAGNAQNYRRRLLAYLTASLSKGIESGEFIPVPLEETATLILTVINGIVRNRDMNEDPSKNMREAAVDFCRRSLLLPRASN